MRDTASLAATLAGLVLLPLAVNATTLASNLSNTTAGSLSPQSTFWIAQKFTNGPAAATLSALQFRGARNASQTLAISVWSDSANLPSAQIGAVDASGVTTTLGVQGPLPAIGTISLAAATSYWVVIAPSDVNTAQWTQESDLTHSGAGDIPNAKASSSTGGASWSALVNASSNLMLQVDGVLVDTTPDAFAFVDQTDVPLATPVTSDPITVTGINAPSPVTVVGGAYSISNGPFVSSPGVVANGDTVRVRHTSSASLSSTVNTTLTIGTVSDTFSSTTVAQLSVVEVPTLTPLGLLLLAGSLAVGSLYGLRARASSSRRRSGAGGRSVR